MSDERCENCRFWIKDEEPDSVIGGCRRYPPAAGSTWTDCHLPITNRKQWCGEWHPISVSVTPQTDVVELVNNLDTNAIRDRMDNIDREREALKILLRAALSKGV